MQNFGASYMDNINAFTKLVLRSNPMHANYLKNALGRLSEDELGQLEAYINFCLDDGLDLDFVAESYNTIVNDSLREQIYFSKKGSYRHNKSSETYKLVYNNPGFMKRYMHGLALTTFAWPNHAAIHKFFVENLPRTIRGKYLEIGPGHGFYFLQAIRLSSYTHFKGIDISATSIELTRRIVNYHLQQHEIAIELVKEDFFDAERNDEFFDAIVMGEVLEHVEDPLAFLERIRSLSHKKTFIFITTCINAPAIDHIYLFKNTEEVEDIIARANLHISKKLYVPYVGLTLEECIERRLGINVAFVLRK